MPKKIKLARSLIWLLALPLIIGISVLISNAVSTKNLQKNLSHPAQKQALKKSASNHNKSIKKSTKPKLAKKPENKKPSNAKSTTSQVSIKTKASPSSSSATSSSKSSKRIIASKLKVSLVVDKGSSVKTYPTEVKEGSTVFDVLKTASAKYNFSLKYTNYSYGVFIEEIDSLANNPANSMYWLYYMNGKLASVGASAQKVKEGDDILWKYEKTN